MVNRKLTLDAERKSYENVSVMQNDNKSRNLDVTIVSNSKPIDLTGCTVVLGGAKSDGNPILLTGEITDAKKGKASIELTNQTLSVAGIIKATIVILKGEVQLSVLPFSINVTVNPYDSNAIESTPEFSALNDALSVAGQYSEELKDASTNLEEKYTNRLNGINESLAENTNRRTEWINVKSLGAKGDGVTDDTEVFKYAILISLATGKVLYIPNGVYILTETLYILSGRGWKIIGDGIFSTQLKSSATHTFSINAPSNNFEFRDFSCECTISRLNSTKFLNITQNEKDRKSVV